MLREAKEKEKKELDKERLKNLDVNRLVDTICEERDVSISRAFAIVGKQLGKSASWVRDHYTA